MDGAEPISYFAAEAAAQEHLRDVLTYLQDAHQQEVQALRDRVTQLAEALADAAVSASPAVASAEDPPQPSRTSFFVEPPAGKPATAALVAPGAHDPSSKMLRSSSLESECDRGSIRAGRSSMISAPGRSSVISAPGHRGGGAISTIAEPPPARPKTLLGKIRLTMSKVGRIGSARSAEEIRREHESFQTPAQRRVMKMTRRSVRVNVSSTWIGRVVEHPVFDSLCAVMIIVNSVLIGVDVEWRTTHDHTEMWLTQASNGCSLFFLLELLLRIYTYRSKFFCHSEHIAWNWFDMMLVAVSIFDFLSNTLSGSAGQTNIGSSVKAVKMLRIARVIRVFRFFKELSLLALMIIDSMKSLCWALAMLSIILYVFAILFTQYATDYIKENGHLQEESMSMAEAHRQFGNIPRTLYTLLQCMLGGVSWGISSDALLRISPIATILFFFYIFFTMLAFLNITTGVFVDNAVETARTQRDFLVQKESELKEKYLAEMRDLFLEMDEDDSGTVTIEEVMDYFEDPRVQSYFSALGLDVSDTQRLFNLLDIDGSGSVNIKEFLAGCLRLKGMARSIDVQTLILECRAMNKRLDTMTRKVSVVRRCTVATNAPVPEGSDDFRAVPAVIVSGTNFSI